jgi:DeoR/GlpR family transcriptional regulator of sugar metabolism
MAKNPRHNQILTLLNKRRQVTVQELTDRLGVSMVTIRKDLSLLEEQGILIRTHGGAQLAENKNIITNIQNRITEKVDKKERIAVKAMELIQDGDTIFLDAGSTTSILAKNLVNRSLRVVTNSLDILNILSQASDITLISTGGNLRKEAGSFIGPLANDIINKMKIDACFLGTTSFSSLGIFSSQNLIESQTKKTILSVSSRKVIIADVSKFDASGFSIFARSPDIDILITDGHFTGESELIKSGIELLIADN